jgi:hypothetical protein
MNTETIALWTLYTQIALIFIQIPTLIALIVYVIKTWQMATATRLAADSAQNTLLEMQATRDQETAPYVVVYFDVPNDTRSLDLVIKNTGKSMATNVNVVFDPPLQLQSPYQDMLTRVLPPGGIPSIPPDYEIRTAIDFFINYKKSGLPMTFSVHVTYQGGIREEKRTASYNLDLMLHCGTIYTVVNEPTIKDVANELKQLTLTQERIGEKLQQILYAMRPRSKLKKK